ncbi:MAG TPA: PQQ-dependent sugar dehydrogenase [Verrucomicrobiae bacterium]|nr:PQQ-dependent sugar dehydrogenase [Verrucomicrobiae bacterium]
MAFVIALLMALGASAFAAEPYGLAARPMIGPLLNEWMPDSVPLFSGKWSAVPAFPHLLFTNALGLAPIPGTRRLVVWEREGRVYSFDNNPEATDKKLVLDISSQCQGWDDSGLLNLVFHPGFATNHYMYVYYTWVIPGTVMGSPTRRPPTFKKGAYHDRLSRFTLDASGVAVPGSELILVDQPGNNIWHNGSGMFFHPRNGFLYVTDGDDEDTSNCQRIDRGLFSGVWRLDVDMRGGSISHPIRRHPAGAITGNYYIPNDNPFVGQADALEEFYAIGLRNTHRMTCDPLNLRIFLADVGAGSREELDIIETNDPAGLNFQWPLIEGLGGDLKPPYLGVNKRPVLDYPHSDGHSIIGGEVYYGREFAPELGGKYIFGDNVERKIWMLDESRSPAKKILLCILPRGQGPDSGSSYVGLSSFGLDQDHELYICQMSSVGGLIYKLAHSTGTMRTQSLPKLLSQTGAFKNCATLEPAKGLVPYNVNAPLWSDGAVKQRWIALPNGGSVRFAATGEWAFPNGTVFVKQFDLPTDETNPRVLRRLETRLLVRDYLGGVYGVSYKWRPDNSDADLLTEGADEDIRIRTATGSRAQRWHYPSSMECLQCHTGAAGYVLGVKTRQLNGAFTYPQSKVRDNQLRAWNHAGMFDRRLQESAISSNPALAAATNTAASLEERARSYLDSNCSQCHRPGAGVLAFWDARFDTPLGQQHILGGRLASDLNIAGVAVVKPGDPAHSMIYIRANSLGDHQMPPLARNVIDTNAVVVLAQWIKSLQQ